MLEEQNFYTPSKEIFGNPDSFRNELAKHNPNQPTGTTTNTPEAPTDLSSPPEDVQQAVDHAAMSEAIQEDDVAESPTEENTQESIESDAEETPTKSHLIPKSRFNQEIEKRKALEQQLSKEREERIRYETQLQMLDNMHKQQFQQQQAQQLQQQAEQDAIDPLDTDTYNYAKREIESLKAQLAHVTKETETRAQEVFNINTVSAQEAAFSQKHPDFKDAMQHVQKVEFNIAKDLLGDEQAAHAYVADKLKDALVRSLNTGRNAAETIYNMAKTYGFNAQPVQTKVAPKLNVEAISKNMESAANTSNIGNNGTFANARADIRATIGKDGRIDPALFRKQLQRIQKNY